MKPKNNVAETRTPWQGQYNNLNGTTSVAEQDPNRAANAPSDSGPPAEDPQRSLPNVVALPKIGGTAGGAGEEPRQHPWTIPSDQRGRDRPFSGIVRKTPRTSPEGRGGPEQKGDGPEKKTSPAGERERASFLPEPVSPSRALVSGTRGTRDGGRGGTTAGVQGKGAPPSNGARHPDTPDSTVPVEGVPASVEVRDDAGAFHPWKIEPRAYSGVASIQQRSIRTEEKEPSLVVESRDRGRAEETDKPPGGAGPIMSGTVAVVPPSSAGGATSCGRGPSEIHVTDLATMVREQNAVPDKTPLQNKTPLQKSAKQDLNERLRAGAQPLTDAALDRLIHSKSPERKGDGDHVRDRFPEGGPVEGTIMGINTTVVLRQCSRDSMRTKNPPPGKNP